MLGLRAAIDALRFPTSIARRGLCQLATQHRDTAMVARTWLQHAFAMPFGLSLRICRALHRSRARFARLRARRWRCSSAAPRGRWQPSRQRIARGGAISTGAQAAAAAHLAHPSRPHRGSASVFRDSGGTCGKIALISSDRQTDVAERSSRLAKGRGGSSTCPHKRNPSLPATALAAATMRLVSRRRFSRAWCRITSRSARPWHAKWPTLPDAAARHVGRARGDVDMPRGWKSTRRACASILDATHGLITAEAVTMALAEKIGKSEAHHLVEARAGGGG